MIKKSLLKYYTHRAHKNEVNRCSLMKITAAITPFPSGNTFSVVSILPSQEFDFR
jgi:hypothetical protein